MHYCYKYMKDKYYPKLDNNEENRSNIEDANSMVKSGFNMHDSVEYCSLLEDLEKFEQWCNDKKEDTTPTKPSVNEETQEPTTSEPTVTEPENETAPSNPEIEEDVTEGEEEVENEDKTEDATTDGENADEEEKTATFFLLPLDFSCQTWYDVWRWYLTVQTVPTRSV